ncbi:MAG: 1-acyl-sn-glycerol-3-phosphate acyltransferase [Myxococcota bacterium]
MFYRCFRAVVALALRLFYRIQVAGQWVDPQGPVIFVANHPNGLIDPGLLFILTRRHVTFLAKAPLFSLPVLGRVLRWMDALPVYRRQDDPSQMSKNEGSLDAAVEALVQGRAITLFPEGRSHSEPHLSALKTGTARIALRAARRGAKVRIVPIGFTYAEKNLFRSLVLVDVGEAFDVNELLALEDNAAVDKLTRRIEAALRKESLQLERWEDLPLAQTAEALYALRLGENHSDPERLRAFARGVALMRAEQPQRFERLRAELASFRRRLELLRAGPAELALRYRPTTVARFALRNVFALALGLPLFAVGMALFFLPYLVPPLVARALKAEEDTEATVKVLVLFVLAPLWAALLAALSWALWGPLAAAALFGSCLPLALFTRYFYERRTAAWHDARTFFLLGSRTSLKARLLAEGERLAREIETLAAELRERVAQPFV